ncbi:MAG: RNA polymerase sigma factor [Gammaproteobacteria bacterium]
MFHGISLDEVYQIAAQEARKASRNQQDREDLTQEAVLKVIRSTPVHDKNIRGYVRRIARNWITELYSKHRLQTVPLADLDVPSDQGDPQRWVPDFLDARAVLAQQGPKTRAAAARAAVGLPLGHGTAGQRALHRLRAA